MKAQIVKEIMNEISEYKREYSEVDMTEEEKVKQFLEVMHNKSEDDNSHLARLFKNYTYENFEDFKKTFLSILGKNH